jgi:hypothetical protein
MIRSTASRAECKRKWQQLENDQIELLKILARPEGFEPPTLRSEDRFDPQPEETTKGKSLFLQAFSPFLFWLSLSHFVSVWKRGHGNNFILENIDEDLIFTLRILRIRPMKRAIILKPNPEPGDPVN